MDRPTKSVSSLNREFRATISEVQQFALDLHISATQRRRLMELSQQLSNVHGELIDAIHSTPASPTPRFRGRPAQRLQRRASRRSRNRTRSSRSSRSTSSGTSKSERSKAPSPKRQCLSEHMAYPEQYSEQEDYMGDKGEPSPPLFVPMEDSPHVANTDADTNHTHQQENRDQASQQQPEETMHHTTERNDNISNYASVNASHCKPNSSPQQPQEVSQISRHCEKATEKRHTAKRTDELPSHSSYAESKPSRANETRRSNINVTKTPPRYCENDQPTMNTDNTEKPVPAAGHDSKMPNQENEPNTMSSEPQEALDYAVSESGFDMADTSHTAQEVVIGVNDNMSFYSAIDLCVGGITFPNLATALSYFIGLLYGHKDATSYNRAAWVLLSRSLSELESRSLMVIKPISAAWFEKNVPSLAQAIISRALQQSSTFALDMSKLDTDVKEVMHAGTDTIFTTGSRTGEKMAAPGRNLYGQFIRDYVKNRPTSVVSLTRLLPTTFSVNSNFLVLMDSQGRGMDGFPNTTVHVIPGLYAYSRDDKNKSATHVATRDYDLSNFAAMVICVGTNHAEQEVGETRGDFDYMLRKIRDKTDAPIILVGPPPRTDNLSNRVDGVATAMRASSEQINNCTFIDLVSVMGQPAQCRRCLPLNGYHLTGTGKLRLMTVLLEHMPQLGLKLFN